MKELQKRSTNKSDLYLIIYRLLREGKRPSQFAKDLFPNVKNPLTRTNYYLSFFKQRGIIEKGGYGAWNILKDLSELELEKEVKERSIKKSSIGKRITKPSTNLHALEINFPILSGTLKDADWEIKNKLRNWLPKYKGLKDLGGLTIRNNNGKSLTIWAKSRNIESLEEVDNLAFKIKAFANEYFKSKHGVVLDVFNCETKNLNLATEDSESESMLRKGERFELDLKKPAERIFPKDSINAKAWIDGSPFAFSAETNDKEWKRAYLGMPFMVQGMAQSLPAIGVYNEQLAGYAREIKVHREVQKKQVENQDIMNDLLKKEAETREQTNFLLTENLRSTAEMKKMMYQRNNKSEQSNLRRWM